MWKFHVNLMYLRRSVVEIRVQTIQLEMSKEVHGMPGVFPNAVSVGRFGLMSKWVQRGEVASAGAKRASSMKRRSFSSEELSQRRVVNKIINCTVLLAYSSRLSAHWNNKWKLIQLNRVAEPKPKPSRLAFQWMAKVVFDVCFTYRAAVYICFQASRN
jgi:hypothetical protein